MTRKNKLLSIVVIAVLFVACLFGVTFTNKDAKAATVQLPEVDSSSIEGALYVGTGGCRYIASKKATTAEWIIFEWTNGTEESLSNGTNSGYCYIGTGSVSGDIHGTSYGANLWTIFNKKHGTDVKLYFNTVTGQIYKSIDGGNASLVGTFAINNPDGEPVRAKFCLHGKSEYLSTEDTKLENLKIYDSNGKNLQAISSLAAKINPPTSINSNKAQGVDLECSHSNYAFYTEDFVYGEKLIFEWTNGDLNPKIDSFAPGYRATYIIADKDNESSLTGPDSSANKEYVAALHNLNNATINRKFYSDNASVLVVFDMVNGGLPSTYVKEEGETEYTQITFLYSSNQLNSLENIDNGEYKVAIWFNGVMTGKHIFKNLRCYDELGNAYGLKGFNAKYTAKTVTFMDGTTEHAKYENAFPGRSFAQFAELAEPAKANFVGWTATEGDVDFYNKTSPVPANGTTAYARYATAEVTDVSAYVGIYKSTKQYFEITADGQVVSYNNVIPNGTLKVLTDASNTFAKLSGAVGLVNGDTITIDGTAYTKTTDVVEVKYYVDGKLDSTISLPAGMRAPEKKVSKLAKTMNGWRLYEVGATGYYDFGKAITANTSFVADITINYADETAYDTYQFSYYNREENAIYVMRKNKTYTYTKGDEVVNGTYRLVTEGSVFYAVFDADQTKANNPIFIDKVSLQLDKVYNKLDPDGYNVLVVYGNGTEDKVITVDATTSYVANLGANPTKTGYTFKGYVLGDGSAYDVKSIVTGAITIYATWESDGTIAPIEVKTGLSVVSIILIIVAGVALAGGAVYVYLTVIKNKPAVETVADSTETSEEGTDNE